MLILDREMKVIETSLLNAGPISAIAAIDPNLEISGTDLVASRRLHDELKYLDIVAMPLCGVGFSNFGHFLYDGLPSVLMVKNLLRDVNIKLVSQPLTDWQKTLLHHLGLLDDCIEITAPTRFKKLIVTSMLSLHLSYPTSFTRIVFDTLKFSIGSSAATGLPTKVFLSRRGVEKRKLVNRDEVEARLLGLGFDIVYTNEISIEDQARRLSAARFVIGESGAAMANIGFCDANGAVIEILPHADLWTRGACNIFGLRWHAFFPHVEIAPDDGTPEWSRISFEIDCDELEAAIKTIRMID